VEGFPRSQVKRLKRSKRDIVGGFFAQGQSVKVVAARVGLAPGTVYRYLREIKQKIADRKKFLRDNAEQVAKERPGQAPVTSPGQAQGMRLGPAPLQTRQQQLAVPSTPIQSTEPLQFASGKQTAHDKLGRFATAAEKAAANLASGRKGKVKKVDPKKVVTEFAAGKTIAQVAIGNSISKAYAYKLIVAAKGKLDQRLAKNPPKLKAEDVEPAKATTPTAPAAPATPTAAKAATHSKSKHASKVADLVGQGKSVAEISKETGLSKMAIYKQVKAIKSQPKVDTDAPAATSQKAPDVKAKADDAPGRGNASTSTSAKKPFQSLSDKEKRDLVLSLHKQGKGDIDIAFEAGTNKFIVQGILKAAGTSGATPKPVTDIKSKLETAIKSDAKPPKVQGLKGKVEEDEWQAAWKSQLGKLAKNESNAVTEYTASGYHKLNKALRGIEGKPNTKLTELLDAALAKGSVPRDITVTRGLREFNLESLKVGGVITDKGYVSTSIGKGAFGGTQLKIKVPKGSQALYVADISAYKKEKELLLPRDSQFKVTKITQKGPKQIIEVELLPRGTVAA
jgi:DNA-binding NarL/FixJ family response regulator